MWLFSSSFPIFFLFLAYFCLIFPLFFSFFSLFSTHPIHFSAGLGGGGRPPPLVNVCRLSWAQLVLDDGKLTMETSKYASSLKSQEKKNSHKMALLSIKVLVWPCKIGSWYFSKIIVGSLKIIFSHSPILRQNWDTNFQDAFLFSNWTHMVSIT